LALVSAWEFGLELLASAGEAIAAKAAIEAAKIGCAIRISKFSEWIEVTSPIKNNSAVFGQMVRFKPFG
jgi:hypothetical protein